MAGMVAYCNGDLRSSLNISRRFRGPTVCRVIEVVVASMVVEEVVVVKVYR